MEPRRASHLLRTGYLPQGAIPVSTLGSLVSNSLARPTIRYPTSSVRSLSTVQPKRMRRVSRPDACSTGRRRRGANGVHEGQTGSRHRLARTDLCPPRTASTPAALGLLEENGTRIRRVAPRSRDREPSSRYDRAARLMLVPAGGAFDLDREPDRIRDSYGRNLFGPGVSPRASPGRARRGLRGNEAWDIRRRQYRRRSRMLGHAHDNFKIVRRLSDILDSAWATPHDRLAASRACSNRR